ncbi:unnamed protein product [Heterosigma akashiwo]
MNHYSFQTKFGCDDFDEMKLSWVAHGWTRDVYYAQIKGDKQCLAIKKMKNGPSSWGQQNVRLEAVTLSLLQNAPNIAQLEGVCQDNAEIALEWLPVDLNHLPHNELNENQLMLIALDMAEGLAQLHAIPHGPFLHNDLHLGQWMLNSDGIAKLGDLNGGWFLPRNNQGELCSSIKKRKPQMLNPWRSPEEYLDLPLDEKSDIFNLGLNIWALLVGGAKTPYPPNQLAGKTVAEFVSGGGHPLLTNEEKAKMWPVQVRDILLQCWAKAPAARPTAAEVGAVFQSIVQEQGWRDTDRYRPPPAKAMANNGPGQ